jgi:hypothetical protein
VAFESLLRSFGREAVDVRSSEETDAAHRQNGGFQAPSARKKPDHVRREAKNARRVDRRHEILGIGWPCHSCLRDARAKVCIPFATSNLNARTST